MTTPRAPLRTALFAVLTAAVTFGAIALIVSIFTRKQEARNPWVRLVEVGEGTFDPAVWGTNWPRQYEGWKRTVDYERTRYGGSDALPEQKLDRDPWLKRMFSGYAFSIDYREARGHAYMLLDQEQTERVLKRPQPGACLHCHASILPLYRHVGGGDVQKGFEAVCAMPYQEARALTDDAGAKLVQHPVTCLDCHDPETMRLRVTRPGFLAGIRVLKASQGIADYDPNRDATRQEMRSFVCGQCHVEYYFRPQGKVLTYPWANGLKVEEIEAYYDEIGYSDWKHGITGAGVLKAQHPEFEMWSQGTHARAGVACADCHMPYVREGATKVSDHQVRSPLLMVSRSCQVCHAVPEDELVFRAQTIQSRTQSLIERASQALVAMYDAISSAQASGATEAQLAGALALQRKAQFRLDFVYSENSRGFHASQESARILAESIDYARQAEVAAVALRSTPPSGTPREPEPVHGVTPAALASR